MATADLDRIAPTNTIPRKMAPDLDASKGTPRGLERDLAPL